LASLFLHNRCIKAITIVLFSLCLHRLLLIVALKIAVLSLALVITVSLIKKACIIFISDISPSSHRMTAEDCINIAEYAHISRRYTRMEEWAKEAQRIYDNEPNRIGNATKLTIYELLGWTSYLVRNIRFSN